MEVPANFISSYKSASDPKQCSFLRKKKKENAFLGAQAKRGASNSLILQEEEEGEGESDH